MSTQFHLFSGGFFLLDLFSCQVATLGLAISAVCFSTVLASAVYARDAHVHFPSGLAYTRPTVQVRLEQGGGRHALRGAVVLPGHVPRARRRVRDRIGHVRVRGPGPAALLRSVGRIGKSICEWEGVQVRGVV